MTPENRPERSPWEQFLKPPQKDIPESISDIANSLGDETKQVIRGTLYQSTREFFFGPSAVGSSPELSIQPVERVQRGSLARRFLTRATQIAGALIGLAAEEKDTLSEQINKVTEKRRGE